MTTDRILIAGWPLTGKSTYAHALATRQAMGSWHSDSRELDRTAPHCGTMCRHVASGLDWSDASAEVATWFGKPGPWIIEGVAVPRALRKWLQAHPTGRPCDVVRYLRVPFVPLNAGQSAMAKGCDKVWAEVVGELRPRGVLVESQ
jgi:hypothetical protein